MGLVKKKKRTLKVVIEEAEAKVEEARTELVRVRAKVAKCPKCGHNETPELKKAKKAFNLASRNLVNVNAMVDLVTPTAAERRKCDSIASDIRILERSMREEKRRISALEKDPAQADWLAKATFEFQASKKEMASLLKKQRAAEKALATALDRLMSQEV